VNVKNVPAKIVDATDAEQVQTASVRSQKTRVVQPVSFGKVFSIPLDSPDAGGVKRSAEFVVTAFSVVRTTVTVPHPSALKK
jgi:hypothetical protein